jgi:hypothetical protein
MLLHRYMYINKKKGKKKEKGKQNFHGDEYKLWEMEVLVGGEAYRAHYCRSRGEVLLLDNHQVTVHRHRKVGDDSLGLQKLNGLQEHDLADSRDRVPCRSSRL